MKKLGKIFAIASALLFATSMYFSCSNNADNNNNEQEGGNNGGTTDDKKNDNNSDDKGTSDSTPSSGAITESGIEYAKLSIDVKASATTFPQDFVRGFDASTVYAIEGAGMKYLDADGKETDIFEMLKASGVNMIRLRIWNDPSKDTKAEKQGNNNLEVTKALAKRVMNAGMKYMLDFHFSDTWADPSNQKCPDAWKGITTPEEMKTAIANFVENTLNKLKEVGLPEMVQLGNECEGGILLTNTANDAVKANLKTEVGKNNFKTYINAAAEKVRAADENIKIVMHASRGGDTSVVNGFISNTSGITYDYIGLSYYPFFESHKSLEDLKASINAITAKGKKAIISETSFCWTCDWVKGKCDDENNQLYYYSGNDGLVQAAKSLVDSKGNLVMGLTTTTYKDKTVIAPTVQNHYNAVAAVMEAAAAAGADGVIYWGGDWITNSAGSVPSAMENQAFWDYDHKILDSAAVFSYGTSASNAAAGKTSSGGNGGSSSDNGIIKSGTVTMESSPIEFVSATTLSKLNISSLTVTATDASYTGDSKDDWSFKILTSTDWKNETELEWSADINGYKKTISGDDLANFKSSGIFVYGWPTDIKATVTVTYE